MKTSDPKVKLDIERHARAKVEIDIPPYWRARSEKLVIDTSDEGAAGYLAHLLNLGLAADRIADPMTEGPLLTSWERTQLATFIQLSRESQVQWMASTKGMSGPLIHACKQVLKLI
jgi:hypothetical protein